MLRGAPIDFSGAADALDVELEPVANEPVEAAGHDGAALTVQPIVWPALSSD
jgi:hypothetical protein